MKSTDLSRAIARLTYKTWATTDIEHRARRLREARMLPTGRGSASPEIEPAEAVSLVIALGACEHAVHVVNAVMRYAPMVPVGGLGASFCGASTFGDALAEILADVRWLYNVERVAIRRNWPEATITWRQAGEERTAIYRPEGTPDRGYGDAVQVDVIFGAGFLHQLAIDLAEPPESGEWTREVPAP